MSARFLESPLINGIAVFTACTVQTKDYSATTAVPKDFLTLCGCVLNVLWEIKMLSFFRLYVTYIQTQ